MVRHDHLRALWFLCGLIPAGLAAGAAPAGDPGRGLELMRASEKGNCSICHIVPGIGLPEEAQGNIGPPLAGVGARLTEAELVERLVDARKVDPGTMMPPYGTTEGLRDVAAKYAGRPILTPEEIADVVAYLETLR